MNFLPLRALPLLLFSLFASPSFADDKAFEIPLQQIQDEWAEAFYHLPDDQQATTYKTLLARIRELGRSQPHRAEPLIVEAVILCTYAAAEWGLSSLTRLNDARRLLIQSIDRDPKAMDASAYITLGNLYYRLPGWPISYGDEEQALVYLDAAARMYPNALDANYFLGDYWLQEGDLVKARHYLERAERAPIRMSQRLSDEKIKEQVRSALAALRKNEAVRGDFFSTLVPSFDDSSSH